MQLTYKKWKWLQIAEMKKNYQKMKFLSNLEIKNNIKSGTKKIQDFTKNLKNQVSEISRTERKIVIRLRIFQWHHPVKLFNEKSFICETCHKLLYKSEIPCQVVRNKKALDPIYEELKDHNSPDFPENLI